MGHGRKIAYGCMTYQSAEMQTNICASFKTNLCWFFSAAGDKSGDETEKFIPLSAFGRKHNPHWYGRRIAKFGRAGKVGKSVSIKVFQSVFPVLLFSTIFFHALL